MAERVNPNSRLRAVVAFALIGVSAVRGQPGPTPVAVAEVVRQDVATGKVFVGTIMPLRTSSVGSAVAGRVIEYPINEGDRVKAGQALARLLTETQEIELASARALLELRAQQLAELENGTRPEEIERAKALMLAAQARMDYAAKNFKRIKGLFDRQQAADDELDAASSKADETAQAYQETKAAHALAVAGPRKEQIAQARAQVRVQEEAVRRIEDVIRMHTMIAPFDGYISAKRTEVGAWVASAQIVAEVVELDVVEARVMVVEDFAANLLPGVEARVEVPSLPSETFTGVVSRVVPMADHRSRSFPVDVRIENRVRAGQPVIKAGMFARITLPVGSQTQALMVPKDAIVLGGPTPMVFVVDADKADARQGVVRAEPVELGVAGSGLVQVVGRLAAGQRVVVQGNERLRPGQPVMVSEQAPSAAGRPLSKR